VNSPPFHEFLRMTILDCCISLKIIKKILVVLGVVDMRQLLLKRSNLVQRFFELHPWVKKFDFFRKECICC
jgi:hypothetical protein